MRILEIKTIENGLNWDDIDRIYTKNIFENGYEKIDEIYISIELNNQIHCIGTDSILIDGKSYYNSDDLIKFLFAG